MVYRISHPLSETEMSLQYWAIFAVVFFPILIYFIIPALIQKYNALRRGYYPSREGTLRAGWTLIKVVIVFWFIFGRFISFEQMSLSWDVLMRLLLKLPEYMIFAFIFLCFLTVLDKAFEAVMVEFAVSISSKKMNLPLFLFLLVNSVLLIPTLALISGTNMGYLLMFSVALMISKLLVVRIGPSEPVDERYSRMKWIFGASILGFAFSVLVIFYNMGNICYAFRFLCSAKTLIVVIIAYPLLIFKIMNDLDAPGQRTEKTKKDGLDAHNGGFIS
jgi:hypothetical protein